MENHDFAFGPFWEAKIPSLVKEIEKYQHPDIDDDDDGGKLEEISAQESVINKKHKKEKQSPDLGYVF